MGGGDSGGGGGGSPSISMVDPSFKTSIDGIE